MMARTLAKRYGHFAAALGTCILVILAVAHTAIGRGRSFRTGSYQCLSSQTSMLT